MERKQLCYDMIGASFAGVHEHPQRQMNALGYNVIAAVPQTITDQWWFTVKDYIEPMPPYLHKMQYDFTYWHDNKN